MKYSLYRVERFKECINEDGEVEHKVEDVGFVWVTHDEFEEFSEYYACPEYRVVYEMMVYSREELDRVVAATKWEMENCNDERTV